MSDLQAIEKTCDLLGGISRQTVYNLIRTGRLRKVNLGRRAFITTESINSLLVDLKSGSSISPRSDVRGEFRNDGSQ
jgi:predicted site-specific integrase-resolvase